jgi:hypothetical protein
MSTLTWHLNRLAGTLSGGAGGVSLPVFKAAGAHINGVNTAASFPVPAGVAAGDVIVLPIYIDATGSITSYASGFVEAPDSPVALSAGGVESNFHVVWKRATGADAGTYAFTLSGSLYRAGTALAYSGCLASGNPWDTIAGTPHAATAVDNTAGTATPAVSFTTTAPGRKLIFVGSDWSGGSWTPPPTFVERMDSGDGVHSAADKDQPLAGSSGSVVATCTGSSKRSAWLGALIGVSSGGGGTSGAATRTAVAAANLWAGTSGLSLVDAVNHRAGFTVPARDLAGALNVIAGTSRLTPLDAISRIP